MERLDYYPERFSCRFCRFNHRFARRLRLVGHWFHRWADWVDPDRDGQACRPR